jgi:hypothetical protein
MPKTAATPAIKKRRERRHECGQFIRYPGRGSKYQVRLWLPLKAGGSINAGLYSEWMASRVLAAVIAEMKNHSASALGIWRALCAVLDRFRSEGYPVPAHVWPKYVHRRPDGTFFAKVKKADRMILLDGPYSTPEDAHLAMFARLARLARLAV